MVFYDTFFFCLTIASIPLPRYISTKFSLISNYLTNYSIPYDDGNMLRPCMIVDRPDILRKYYEEFKPYETHEKAVGYLTNPEIIEKIDRYSKEVKEILDEDWKNNLWMTIFPLFNSLKGCFKGS